MKTVGDVLDGIARATTKAEMKAIVEEMDELWRDGKMYLEEADWPRVSRAVSNRIGELENPLPF